MYPILFRIGPHIIYSYSIVICLGLLIGLVVIVWTACRQGIPAQPVLEATLCAATGGMLLGRVAYMLPQLEQYLAQPEMIANWGNQRFHGVLVGSVGGVWLYSRWRQVGVLPLLDALTIGLPVIQAFGWLAMLLHGGNYGATTYTGWAWELPDIYGIVTPRIPTQFLGILAAALLIAWVSYWRRQTKAQGAVFALYLAADAMLFFAVAFTRAPTMPMMGPLRLSQWLYAAQFLLALAFVIRQRSAPSSMIALDPS